MGKIDNGNDRFLPVVFGPDFCKNCGALFVQCSRSDSLVREIVKKLMLICWLRSSFARRSGNAVRLINTDRLPPLMESEWSLAFYSWIFIAMPLSFFRRTSVDAEPTS